MLGGAANANAKEVLFAMIPSGSRSARSGGFRRPVAGILRYVPARAGDFRDYRPVRREFAGLQIDILGAVSLACCQACPASVQTVGNSAVMPYRVYLRKSHQNASGAR